MSPKRGSTEKPKLRMDDYSDRDKDGRLKGVLNPRREIDKVIKKARRDGYTTSEYWTKKLLEVEEKEPDRWHHSGYKELYVNNGFDKSSRSSSLTPKKRVMYSPSAPTSPLVRVRASRKSSTPSRRTERRSVSPDPRRSGGRGSPHPRTDRFSSSSRPSRNTKSSPPPSSTVSFRRVKSPNAVARSPVRISRSPTPPRRNKVAAATGRRVSPKRRSRSLSSPVARARKASPRRRAGGALKSPATRSARSPMPAKTAASSSRQLKSNRTRNRSVEKLLTSSRRKYKSPPKVARCKSPPRLRSTSPVLRRRSKVRSRSPLMASKRKIPDKSAYRYSSSSGSRYSSRSPSVRKKNSKQIISSEILSSSDCSDSNCSMCRFEKNTKERKKIRNDREKITKRTSPVVEARVKPRATLPQRLPVTSSSRYARSRSLSVPVVVSSPAEDRRAEVKHKKKPKKEKKKVVVKASKAITTSIIHNKKIKVETPSDESESPSPKRVTLSDRFGKMAKWNQKRDLESNQRNIRVTAGDNYRVEELDVPLLEPFPEPPPLVLDGSWDDVRVRYTYYKEQGYLEDLSFQDYLKWEEWWYGYQEWLESERLLSMRRRM